MWILIDRLASATLLNDVQSLSQMEEQAHLETLMEKKASIKDVVVHAHSVNPWVKKECVIKEWSEFIASDETLSGDPVTAGASGQPWNATLNKLIKDKLSLTPADADTVESIHPDAQIRRDGFVKPLVGLDRADQLAGYRCIWRWVRAGQLERAQDSAMQLGLDWLASCISGCIEVLDDEGGEESGHGKSGNARRVACLKTCFNYADTLASCSANWSGTGGRGGAINNVAALELGIYSALSNNVSGLVKSGLVENWSDVLWAVSKCCLERDVLSMLHSFKGLKRNVSGYYVGCDDSSYSTEGQYLTRVGQDVGSMKCMTQLLTHATAAAWSLVKYLPHTPSLTGIVSSRYAGPCHGHLSQKLLEIHCCASDFILYMQAALIQGLTGVTQLYKSVLVPMFTVLCASNSHAHHEHAMPQQTLSVSDEISDYRACLLGNAEVIRVSLSFILWCKFSPQSLPELRAMVSDELFENAIISYVNLLALTEKRALAAPVVALLPVEVRVAVYADIMKSIPLCSPHCDILWFDQVLSRAHTEESGPTRLNALETQQYGLAVLRECVEQGEIFFKGDIADIVSLVVHDAAALCGKAGISVTGGSLGGDDKLWAHPHWLIASQGVFVYGFGVSVSGTQATVDGVAPSAGVETVLTTPGSAHMGQIINHSGPAPHRRVQPRGSVRTTRSNASTLTQTPSTKPTRPAPGIQAATVDRVSLWRDYCCMQYLHLLALRPEFSRDLIKAVNNFACGAAAAATAAGAPITGVTAQMLRLQLQLLFREFVPSVLPSVQSVVPPEVVSALSDHKKRVDSTSVLEDFGVELGKVCVYSRLHKMHTQLSHFEQLVVEVKRLHKVNTLGGGTTGTADTQQALVAPLLEASRRVLDSVRATVDWKSSVSDHTTEGTTVWSASSEGFDAVGLVGACVGNLGGGISGVWLQGEVGSLQTLQRHREGFVHADAENHANFRVRAHGHRARKLSRKVGTLSAHREQLQSLGLRVLSAAGAGTVSSMATTTSISTSSSTTGTISLVEQEGPNKRIRTEIAHVEACLSAKHTALSVSCAAAVGDLLQSAQVHIGQLMSSGGLEVPKPSHSPRGVSASLACSSCLYLLDDMRLQRQALCAVVAALVTTYADVALETAELLACTGSEEAQSGAMGMYEAVIRLPDLVSNDDINLQLFNSIDE